MKITHLILAFFLCILSAGCERGRPPAAKEQATKSEANLSETRSVNRYEFVEKKLVLHPEDEVELNHKYLGSHDGYDYISVRNHRYKIPSDQLNLNQSFPLTEDVTKWVPLRIHFSHIEYALD